MILFNPINYIEKGERKLTKRNLYQAVKLFEEVLLTGSEVISKKVDQNLFDHVSKQQFELLNTLKIKGPSSPGNLALVQCVHKSAISNRLKKLLNKGLVQWESPDANDDKRSKLVSITPQGEKLISEMDKAIFAVIEDILSNIEDEKIDTFIDIFTTVKETLIAKGDSTDETNH